MSSFRFFSGSIFISVLFVPILLFAHSSSPAANLELQTTDTYQEQEDIQGWYMSEKLDGIRGYWDGKKLWTKNGNPIHAPVWFTDGLPNFELDGELWSSQGKFEFIASTVLDATPSPQWHSLTYNIFEVPHARGDFQTRLNKIATWLRSHPNKHVRIIAQQPCNGRDHLYDFLKQVRERDGEGIILKDPRREYRDGSNQRVLKLKNYSRSTGSVIGYTPGKGQFKGMMGSLRVSLKNGTLFNLGTGFNKEQRMHPPAIGSTVLFKHCGLTRRGKPRFASFLRITQE